MQVDEAAHADNEPERSEGRNDGEELTEEGDELGKDEAGEPDGEDDGEPCALSLPGPGKAGGGKGWVRGRTERKRNSDATDLEVRSGEWRKSDVYRYLAPTLAATIGEGYVSPGSGKGRKTSRTNSGNCERGMRQFGDSGAGFRRLGGTYDRH